MTYDSLPPWFKTIAETVCTPTELAIVKHRASTDPAERSWTAISRTLNISVAAARYHYANAERKILNHKGDE